MNNFSDDAEARMRTASANPEAPTLDPALVSGASARRAPRLMRHGRASRVAAASVTALAAVTVGALVVTNPFAPQAPLFTAAGANGGAEAAALGADARMMMWVNYQYEAGAELSTDGDRGKVYELRRVGSYEQVLRDAAGALGLEGEIHESEWSPPEYPTYLIGPEDGSAASLTLNWSSSGEWWYNNPQGYPASVCETVAVEGSETGETYESCGMPEIPASESRAPGADEAAQIAAELFDVDAADVDVTVDPWGTTATSYLVVDGQTTSLSEAVSWSTLGEIVWASGRSIEVVERGSYDTVSPTAAVDRLSDGRWFGAAGPDYQGGMAMYAGDTMLRGGGAPEGTPVTLEENSGSEPVAEPGVEPGAEPGSEPGVEPGVEPTVEPAPDVVDPGLVDPSIDPSVDPGVMPEPETVTVTLEKSEATLLLMWDADGNMWLVPGYAYENPEGGFWHTVVSLIEGVIALPELEAVPLPALLG